MSDLSNSTGILTPVSIEQRLNDLAREINDSHIFLTKAETDIQKTISTFELAMARSRIELSTKSAPNGKNYTVGEREDLALIENETAYISKAIAEANVKSARANTRRLETLVDIARSQGTSIRSSLTVN